MGDRNALEIANEAADIAEAQAREAEAKRRRAFADVQRHLAWFLVLFGGPGGLLLAAFRIVEKLGSQ